MSIIFCVLALSCAKTASQQSTLSSQRSDQAPSGDTLGIPAQQSGEEETGGFFREEKPEIFEDEIEPLPEAAPESGAQVVPSLPFDSSLAGGSVRIYAYHGFLDPAFLSLVQGTPCIDTTAPDSAGIGDDSASAPRCRAPVVIRRLSDRRVELILTDLAVDSKGNSLSAFDFAEKLAAHVRKHPAEGYSMLRYVKGITAFIAGREAVIPGFRISNERTLVMSLERSDPLAANRVCTSRLLPAVLGLGPYWTARVSEKEVILVCNTRFCGRRPLLDTVVIVTEGEISPLLSFNHGRYECVLVGTIEDLEYIKREISDSVTLTPVSWNRYFVAASNIEPSLRPRVAALIHPQELLANYAKAPGECIGALEADSLYLHPADSAAVQQEPPPIDKPLSILFHSDDIIASRVAQKLASDLSGADFGVKLNGMAGTAYQQALVSRSWDIALGCVPSSATSDPAEQLRLAALWFNDETDELARIKSMAEIPLFKVARSILCKQTIALLDSSLTSLYIRRPGEPLERGTIVAPGESLRPLGGQ